MPNRLIVGVLSLVLLIASQTVRIEEPVPPAPGPVEPPPPVVAPVDPTPAPVLKPDLALYVHEKDKSPVPSGVMAALDEINRKHGVKANVFEDNTTNGNGDIPAQFKAAVEAARNAGLPCFVMMNGNTVLKVVAAPKTKDEVLSEFARLANDH